MTAPRTPRNLTPIELLLRHYATQPDTTLPNPLDILDRSTVHHTAAHGPRTPDDAEHIHATPHLLQLLSELWNDEPPTPTVTATCLATPEGTTLLTATGHHPTNTTDDNAHTENTTAPTGSDPDGLTPDQIDDFLLAIEFTLLTHTLETPTNRGGDPRTPDHDPNRMVFRGGPTPPATPAETRDVWTTTATLPTGHTVTLRIEHKPNNNTGQPTLYIETGDAFTFLTPTHLTWTLTYTHTHPHNGHPCTHTTTATAQDHHATTLNWHIETPHHPTPTNNPTLTLTPTNNNTDTE